MSSSWNMGLFFNFQSFSTEHESCEKSSLKNYLYSCKCNKNMIITNQLLPKNITCRTNHETLWMFCNCGAHNTNRKKTLIIQFLQFSSGAYWSTPRKLVRIYVIITYVIDVVSTHNYCRGRTEQWLKSLRILEVGRRLQNGIRELRTIRLVLLWVAGGPAHLSFIKRDKFRRERLD